MQSVKRAFNGDVEIHNKKKSCEIFEQKKAEHIAS